MVKHTGKFSGLCHLWITATILILAGLDGGIAQTLQPATTALWADGVGLGFRPCVQTLTLEIGGNAGLTILGSQQRHDLVLGSLSYGQMLGPVMATNHWFRGNWELRAELFGGTQYSPGNNWLVGLTPHLRYNFATGTRWIPFVDCGAGVTATDIRLPDLGSTFEFNLQAGGGVHWFLKERLALTAEARYLHLSDAGMTHPNNGVNGVMGMIGVTWFFD